MTHDHDNHQHEEGLPILQVGQKAPKFHDVQSYHKGEFHKVSLSDFVGKWLVLFFYPRDFTFVCPTEIEEFGKHYEAFKEIGCEIVGASTDSEHSHKAWYETDKRLGHVMFPVLADTTLGTALKYRILDTDGSSQRGTFIIDPEGILRFMLVSSDSVGRNIPETLRVVKALQTGERCPAGWEQGKATLGKA